jgi:serine/threonine-protein kinase
LFARAAQGEMSLNTVADLLSSIRSLHLLEPAQLDKVAAVQAKIPEPQALLKKLVSQGWLTAFQARWLFAGRGNDLLLGSYVLIDRLGEGGMGEVYKAKNWKIGKVVALKVIRKERLKNATAVKRFHREIEMASRLSHPNIVQAFDAGQVGNTHYFAMELVEGQDLTQMVKQAGPVPFDKATEYMRQAALGLQHAHEKGLIHRDIKPSNIFISQPQGSNSQGTVKLLDMGLARMNDSEDMSTLTQEGSVLGTIDYLAPEQALNAHTADIRSDLYSLGCTFYYILAGKVPFDGGSATEKLLKHRLEEPKPLEEIRKDVPAAVIGIVRKLMAKRPEDRYQTPAELVADLSGNVGRLAKAAPPTNAPLDGQTSKPRGKRKWPLIAGGAVAAFLLLIVISWLASSGSSDPKGSNQIASGKKPTGTHQGGTKPVKPTQPEARYVKMGSREETILATLRSAGLPTLEGKWYAIGFFDFDKNKVQENRVYETVCPPEQEIDLSKSYTGKQNKQVSWKERPEFGPGRVGIFSDLMPNAFLANIFSLSYVYCEVDVPEAVDLPVAFAGEDTLLVFLNREKVFSRLGLGPYSAEQNVAPLRFKAGKNQLLLKLASTGKVTVTVLPQWPAKLNGQFGDSLNRDFPVK